MSAFQWFCVPAETPIYQIPCKLKLLKKNVIPTGLFPRIPRARDHQTETARTYLPGISLPTRGGVASDGLRSCGVLSIYCDGIFRFAYISQVVGLFSRRWTTSSWGCIVGFLSKRSGLLGASVALSRLLVVNVRDLEKCKNVIACYLDHFLVLLLFSSNTHDEVLTADTEAHIKDRARRGIGG